MVKYQARGTSLWIESFFFFLSCRAGAATIALAGAAVGDERRLLFFVRSVCFAQSQSQAALSLSDFW